MKTKTPALTFLPISLVLSCVASVRVRADPLDTWHWRNPLPNASTILSVTHGGGRFVAAGYLGTISTGCGPAARKG